MFGRYKSRVSGKMRREDNILGRTSDALDRRDNAKKRAKFLEPKKVSSGSKSKAKY